jgi:hypothetical protein
VDTFRLFASRFSAQPSAAEPPASRPTYRGIKGDEALIAEIAQRLGDRPHRIEPVLEVAVRVLTEWRENGWWPNPLDPICGSFGDSRTG